MSRDKETKKQTDRPGPRGDPTRGGSPKNVGEFNGVEGTFVRHSLLPGNRFMIQVKIAMK